MLFKANTPVKYRGGRVEIGEVVEILKKDAELLSNYGEIIEDEKPKKEPKAKAGKAEVADKEADE